MTVQTAACIEIVNGNTVGVHNVTTTVTSKNFNPIEAYGYFEGETAACVRSPSICQPPNSYTINLDIKGKLPNIVQVVKDKAGTGLECAITSITSFQVTYTPTGQTFTFGTNGALNAATGICI